jgi:hypothetical protein
MRQTTSWTPIEIAQWPNYEEFKGGHYRAARPLGGPFTLWQNLRVAWRVFTGQWDALNWDSTKGDSRGNAGLGSNQRCSGG